MPKPRMNTLDVAVDNQGSIVLLDLYSPAAKRWVTDHIAGEHMWFGGRLVVEPRYVMPLLHGMEGDGLVIGNL